MRGRRPRERGMALLALLAVIALGASWFIVSQLNAESNVLTAVKRSRNADTLNRAKQALIGYIAMRAATAGENSPGAFPCPEDPATFNDATNEGTTEGATVPGSCTPLVVGRFPWRALGLDKLVDVAGEPLWYAVASGWTGANTVINSNCAYYNAAGLACQSGRLRVDGAAISASDVIALIIAPGPAITVSTSTNCAAWTQTRSTAAPPDWRNYLECQNATSPADDTFATTGPSGSFNDQLVTITLGDLMPALEAAIAGRMDREIVPALKSVYASSTWHGSLGAANPLMPYPVPFGDPGTSNYHGVAGQSGGLLPIFQTQGCTPATDSRCTTATTGPSAFLVFSKAAADTYVALIDLLNLLNLGWIRTQSTCNWSSETYICTGEYAAFPIAVTLQLRVSNVAMGLRAFDTSKITCTAVDDAGQGIPEQNIGCASKSVELQSDGSAIATVVTNWTPSIITSGWGTYANYKISFDRVVFGDHALVGTTDPTTGWFARNRWHEVVYYASATGRTAAALPTLGCTTGSTCLSVGNLTPAGTQRAILILAGRSINSSSRPSSILEDYLEFGNAGASYESHSVTAASTVVPTATNIANAYSITSPASIANGANFFFKAMNANSGAATLTTPATGAVPLSIVNSDGSSLAASTIRAGAVVQVTYNGSRFVLSKRPFNDRIVVVDSNP